MVAWGWIRGVGVGFGEGRGLARRHLWICVIGAMRFGEDVWVVCSGLVMVGSNLMQAREECGEIGAHKRVMSTMICSR
jgi:hypothetical protein